MWGMREILFRGKRKDNGEWVEGYLVYNHSRKKYYISTDAAAFPIEVIPETVGQYTGLKDKNGTKIFEGDIIKHYNNAIKPGQYEVYLIVFNERRCAFKGWLHKTFSAELRRDLGQHYEVIGDIHDNTELLEVASE